LNSKPVLDAALASEEDISIAFQAQKALTLQHGEQVKNLCVARMILALKFKTKQTSTALTLTLIPLWPRQFVHLINVGV
jgi:hypothetical protein